MSVVAADLNKCSYQWKAHDSNVEWQLPMDGEMKCNVDVAIFQELNPLVCAFVTNNQGQFIKAKTMWFEDTPLASGGNRFEMWLGVMEVSRISIELDCKLMTDCVHQTLDKVIVNILILYSIIILFHILSCHYDLLRTKQALKF
jgi:hypothetical protein